MSASEDDVVRRLIELTDRGTADAARMEAVRSLANYRHHPAVRQRLIELSDRGTADEVRLVDIRVLGGRSPYGD